MKQHLRHTLIFLCFTVLTIVSIVRTSVFAAEESIVEETPVAESGTPDTATGSSIVIDEPVRDPALAPYFRESSITLYKNWDSFESCLVNITEDDVVTYSSSSSKIAKINSEGIISPLRTGTATISATIVHEDGYTETCTMKVDVKAPYYTVTDSTRGLSVGGSYTFRLERFGYEKHVKWTLTGSQYASIRPVSPTDCEITGLAAGDVTLTVSVGGKKTSFDIRIYDQGTGPVYVLRPDDEPYAGRYITRSDYNSKTRQYYLIRSYLEKLSALGGGMLVFSPGTYSVTNTLCIPSNTTVLLEDGAVIQKSEDTGTPYLNATTSLFQTVSYSHTTTKFTGYNGEHDIAILGLGSATIDLALVKCTAIMACHCKNLTIRGINFLNLNSLHFIELDASKNVNIEDNFFNGYTPSPTGKKEAINIDTPDINTNGFKQDWTSYDCTPVKNVCITGNTFYELETAIGTHKYSEGKLHTKITISGNSFINVSTYVIRAMNWKYFTITDNYFTLTGDCLEGSTCIILNGVRKSCIQNNYIRNYDIPVVSYHWKNSGGGKNYEPICNKLTSSDFKYMKQNYLAGCLHNAMLEYDVVREPKDETPKLHKMDSDYIINIAPIE